MNRQRKKIIEENKISKLVTYTLGGYPQKVLIEGRHKQLPILLFLHGGPGFPPPFCVGSRGMEPEITQQYIAVYWDQLGCGINNFKIDHRFGIEDFVNMTTELVLELKKEFPDNPLTIFGTSWGSILAALTVIRVPRLIACVKIYGQILGHLWFNEEVFHTLLEAPLPNKKRKRLEQVEKAGSHSFQDIKFISTLIQKYTDGFLSRNNKNLSFVKLTKQFLGSPDYSLKDCWALFYNGYINSQRLLEELIEIDLSDTLSKVSVPYRILQGELDITTSTKTITAFMKESNNLFLSLRVLPNSAHIPTLKAMDAIMNELKLPAIYQEKKLF